ncbi:methylenetetrahydrofolate reductase [Asanoa ishikariensis]|uniref:Methylenetetrahydrofolate reductase (NADPH) n=1 Tax=Asanoa ishikariensis TaxID=137265 RepID=A0A1H3TER2_9ACTN|nr:5,10-methylenetetrahydrofolate reductase [Asanoa ishikariensis]GIF62562.1 methylenetetrahydrofolate reductase [Asanoa ishikariensis]SDZ48752.1 methylenetetrahydrofolate reductase (NADPH) [Asanoa ishikariensis]
MRDDHETLTRLLSAVRYEVIPTATVESRVRDTVPSDVTVTVTASPTKGLEPTLDVAERLAAAGYPVVPHVAARLITGEPQLAGIVERLVGAGVSDVFVPAGDADPPLGPYDAALPVLTALSSLGNPFPRVGITGYPESHPSIEDDITIQSMWDKRRHATYIVSNLCFDPRVIARWVARVRRRQVSLPLYLGLAGPIDRAKLLSVATKIGVGESTRFVTRHPSWFARLAVPGGYTPDALLRNVVRALRSQDVSLTGLHIFTFNQLAETERWRQDLLARYTH